MRNLASIQKVTKIEDIYGADYICLAHILGWQCIVKKGEFNVGDLCVYFEIDSIIPESMGLTWLKSPRIKTMKMKGVLSQGLALPVSILLDKHQQFVLKESGDSQQVRYIMGLDVGKDVTDELGVTKYEVDTHSNGGPNHTRGVTLPPFPYGVPKTDETRIQSCNQVLDILSGAPYQITVKLDGTSATYYHDGQKFHVCSRNHSLPEDDSDYWKIVRKYDMVRVCTNNPGMFIQGEICGPNWAKNPLRLKEAEFFVFTIGSTFNPCNKPYFEQFEVDAICTTYGLKQVPLYCKGQNFDWTQEKLLKLAEGVYDGTDSKREGLVVRPIPDRYNVCHQLPGRCSFKVINNEYLLKEK